MDSKKLEIITRGQFDGMLLIFDRENNVVNRYMYFGDEDFEKLKRLLDNNQFDSVRKLLNRYSVSKTLGFKVKSNENES